MVQAGDVLESPRGEKVTFHETSRETNGERLRYEAVIVNPGPLAIEHVHPFQSERHEVLDGTLTLSVKGKKQRLTPGDVVLVPKNVPHKIIETDGPIRIMFELRPALRWETLYQILFGLARDDQLTRSGRLKLLQIVAVARAYSDEIRGAKPPWPVQKVLFALLEPIAKARGYRSDFPEYVRPG